MGITRETVPAQVRNALCFGPSYAWLRELMLIKILDDTQIEQPDTPAPVFAVRALKTALFGTPAPKETRPWDSGKGRESQLVETASSDPKSPNKPVGILLTPGTGTSRRKRVSFNQDVKEESYRTGTARVEYQTNIRENFPVRGSGEQEMTLSRDQRPD